MNNPKKLWIAVKDICHFPSKKQECYELLELEGALDTKDSLNICNNYFSTIGQTLAGKILQDLNTDEKELATKVKSKCNMVNSFFIKPTNEYEINSLIESLQNDKAAGIDELNNVLIKIIKDEIASPLAIIFNQSILSGIFPDSWKTACIKPIYKSGTKDSPLNYRSISLLTAFSKLLEKVV